MTTAENILSTLLKDHGYSITSQRLLVFNLLIGQEPMTMHELIDRTNGKIDRASIYRIIGLFDQIGITQRLNIGWKYKIELTDKFAEHHHHLTCLNCHKVIPINKNELEDFIAQLATVQGFTPIDHQVEIQGYCQNCSKKVTKAKLLN
jgi:Fur family ferric uptake transcriptional regulator